MNFGTNPKWIFKQSYTEFLVISSFGILMDTTVDPGAVVSGVVILNIS